MGYIEEKRLNEAALLDAVLSDHEAISSIRLVVDTFGSKEAGYMLCQRAEAMGLDILRIDFIKLVNHIYSHESICQPNRGR